MVDPLLLAIWVIRLVLSKSVLQQEFVGVRFVLQLQFLGRGWPVHVMWYCSSSSGHGIGAELWSKLRTPFPDLNIRIDMQSEKPHRQFHQGKESLFSEMRIGIRTCE